MNFFINRSILLRDKDIDDYSELFLVNSVLSILGIRFFLASTGYPQLGGNGLHIAHMLWGGLALVIALLIAIYFVDKTAKIIASIVGGIGFGFFIDEIGKFVTSDNNYFFQPSFALMYVVLMGLFLLTRQINKSRSYTQQERTAQLFELLQEATLRGLRPEDKTQLDAIVSDSNLPTSFKSEARTLLSQTANLRHDWFFDRLAQQLSQIGNNLVNTRKFKFLMITTFTLKFFIEILFAIILVVGDQDAYLSQFFRLGLLITITVSILITISAIWSFRHNRSQALSRLRLVLAWNIFVVSLFYFYYNQLTAVRGLLINISLYYLISILLTQIKQTHFEQPFRASEA